MNYYFTIAAIFKLEEPYIGDWVKYHLGIGAEHLYLYDNDSPDRSAQIAKDIGGDRVTVEPIHGHPMQHTCHARCLDKYRMDSRWIGFIDIDEYLVPIQNLLTTLKEFEYASALCPHWVLFGSNGCSDYIPSPVAERFTRSQSGADRHVKSIVDPRRTGNWVTAHKFTHSTKAVDERGVEIEHTNSIPDGGTRDKIYIAHYVTKSKAECWERRSRARPDTGEIRYNVQEFWDAHDRNDIENLDVLNIWKTL